MDSHEPPTLAESTLNSIGDAVLSTDLDGNVTYINAFAETMTGWSREEAVGQPLDTVFHIVDRASRQPARNPLALAVRLNQTVVLPLGCILVRRDGREIDIEDSAAPIHDENGQTTGAVIVFRDVGLALKTSREMSHLAQHDVLTGLPNRLLLNDRLEQAISMADRHSQPMAVLFLDVDGFKSVNDSLGHAAGDQLLQAIAAGLSGVLRGSDTVSRYSGDEFVIVLPEISHTEDVATVAKKLLRAASGPHVIGTEEVTVTASIGVATYPDHGRKAETLIRNADAAMYDAKRSGGGNDRLFEVTEPRRTNVAGGLFSPPNVRRADQPPPGLWRSAETLLEGGSPPTTRTNGRRGDVA